MAKLCVFVLAVHIMSLESVAASPQDYLVVSDRDSLPDSDDVLNFTVDHSTADRHDCFQNMCFCVDATADCSKTQGKLPFVPKLPDNITFLDWSYNKLHEIPDNFFLNVTNITGLDLSHNGMTGISSGAFRPLQNLQTLILSYNHRLTYATLQPVFSLPGLKRLDLVHNKLGPLASDHFVKFPMAQLETLNLQENDLQDAFNLSLFSPLKNLRVLSLAYNNIRSAVVPAVLRTLEDLDLSQKAEVFFPTTCNGDESFFPSLRSLSLVGTSGLDVPRHACLPSLEVLQLTISSAIPTRAFAEDHYPALQKLYIDSVQRIEKDAFVTESLKLISFQGSAASYFSDSDLHDDSFRGCPNLSSLSFGGCSLQHVSDGKLKRLFSCIPTLKQLDVSGTGLKQLSVATFASLKSLETLILSGNLLGFLESNVQDGAFDMMVNLTYLDLSNNVLSVVRESMLSPHIRQNLRHLDLSGNLFVCSCDLMWLRNWLISNPAVFSNPRSNYTCTVYPSIESLSVKEKTIDMSSFYLNKQACLMSQLAYFMITICVVQFLMYFLCAVVFFRCRRTIKPMLYDIFRGQGNVGREHIRREDYQYDVFVSYAAEDLPWVRAHLVPELEERQGLRLCLHDRDFRPGRDIVGNITDKLEVSRKVMVVFSTAFARSPWCQFELTLCLTHVMDNADNMLVVYLHDIPPRELTNNMLAVLRTCTYLQWNDEEETRRRFWTRLLEALRAVIEDARHRVGQEPQEQPA